MRYRWTAKKRNQITKKDQGNLTTVLAQVNENNTVLDEALKEVGTDDVAEITEYKNLNIAFGATDEFKQTQFGDSSTDAGDALLEDRQKKRTKNTK